MGYDYLPTYENVQSEIRALCERHERLKAFPIGKSLLGREITALSLGNPAGATCFVGATHGLEWLTCALLMRFLRNLLRALECGGDVSDIEVARALRSRALVIVPCLNPDGVEIALCGAGSAGRYGEMVQRLSGGCPELVWQANAAGVDINHNFDAGWCALKEMELAEGITAPAPTRYGGEHPHSEPETIAIATFCKASLPRSLYSIHSQGEEIYWHYGEHTPARSKMMAQILASSSGYELAKPALLASHGGLKDWFIEKLRRPAFTIEIGRGKNPLPLSDLDRVYAQTEEMLMLAMLL